MNQTKDSTTGEQIAFEREINTIIVSLINDAHALPFGESHAAMQTKAREAILALFALTGPSRMAASSEGEPVACDCVYCAELGAPELCRGYSMLAARPDTGRGVEPAALAITEDVSKAVAPDMAGIVNVTVRLATSDGEYTGHWSIRVANPTEVIEARERPPEAIASARLAARTALAYVAECLANGECPQ